MRRMFAAIVAMTIALVAVPPLSSAAAAERQPVVFVHGWNSSASAWDTMVSRFRADGWSASHLNAWQYSTAQSNVTTAGQLSSYVDTVRSRTGAATVDIVTHSMGGLSSRYYLKNLNSTGKVDEWVSLGGPNHGTSSAYGCPETSCQQMRPGSAFLSNLNAGDETPGALRYGTFWSNCDGVIYPADSTKLTGATNTNVGCVSHSGLRTNAAVYAQVRDFVG
ncbi:MAG: esterase/lipase family protein [Nocardioidaceae bacterium]